ncbi:beta-lactamase family protein [Paenibacillus dendritiformis]|uniref:serine hydrolase domain-containing protein n=1 Tax=Paenibacillus dendritiformis TaxID=130049 RepID=UPI00143D1F13|nr:serine hydrolase domain-containing protein [Paenibacillus dendritiformis]NKI19662.1 beta-lactamase family protein [Paenibacillus dendritiformis]NRF96377.1 beta-lactamase family protein [Paenibacillus dendritiformis]
MKSCRAAYRAFMAAVLLLSLWIGSGVVPTATALASKSSEPSLTEEELSRIEALIHAQMQKGRIPGISVVIVKGEETVYQRGFGFSDLRTGQPITSESVFELGSVSKAFTGLGILRLAEEGQLKLDALVSDYVPWLHMTYTGERQGKRIHGKAAITIRQLLYQTSGIPFRTISSIPASSDDRALEQTVRALGDEALDFYPGERFQYATVNYDILGHIIQQVAGVSYENYIRENVLEPLGLRHTYVSAVRADHRKLVQGHKIGYLRARPYDAPVFRGNTPAGYIYTDSGDMAAWLKIQMGTQSVAGALDTALIHSHLPDRSVPPGEDGSSYAAGWYVYQSGGGELSHGGSNPSFSSYVVFRPEEKLGVAVMANLNSAHTEVIGQGIMDILIRKHPVTEITDIYRSVDQVSLVMLGLAIPFAAFTVWNGSAAILEVVRKRRGLQHGWRRNGLRFLSFVVFVGTLSLTFWQIPQVLFHGVDWKFVEVWAPASFRAAILSVYIALVLFAGYLLLNALFPRQRKQSMFPFAGESCKREAVFGSE